MKKAASNSRDKEMISSLNSRLEHLVMALQTKDKEIATMVQERTKLENKVDSLMLKVESLENDATKRMPSSAETSSAQARKSGSEWFFQYGVSSPR